MALDDKTNIGHRHTTSDIRGGRFPEGMLPSTVIPSIETAQSSAEAALAEAASKSKAIFSDLVASGTDFSEGDTWYQRTAGIIVAQWEFTAGAWAARTLDGAVVANLDASKITTGTLAAGTKITAGNPLGSRVELDEAGLRKYAADGTTVQVDLTGGVAAFSGLITGSEIVGGEFKTATTGARIELGPMDVVAASGGEMTLYSGHAHESSPAALYAFSVGPDSRYTTIKSTEFTQEAGAVDKRAYLQLDNTYSPTPAAQVVESHAFLGAQSVSLQATVPEDPYYNNSFMGWISIRAENRVDYSANAEEYLVGNGTYLSRRIAIVTSDAAKAAFITSHQYHAAYKTAFLHPISASKPLFVWQVDAAAGAQLQYTTNGTTWTAIGGGSGGPPASETVAGIVELASPAETVTGADDQRATTPAGVTAAIYATVAPTGVSYSAGWADFGSDTLPVVWYKDKDGFIHLDGTLKRSGATITNAASGTIFTLPVGARPSGRVIFMCLKDNVAAPFAINASGVFAASGAGTYVGGSAYISVSGISFSAV